MQTLFSVTISTVEMLLLLCLISLLSISAATETEWDILIFTQHWPITVCTEWQESKEGNKCTLPKNGNLWTVHGIWPTKFHTQGPFFCNKTWSFEPVQVDPILNDLELYWMNIEANTPLYSFWKHEWTKHGTCAAQLPAFNTQLNYFKKGLQWVQVYGMANILAKSEIKPDQTGYAVEDIYGSIRKLLHKKPIIECVVDRQSKLSLLSEIRICFDKNLTLVDCDLVKDKFEGVMGGDVLTNCDLKKSVMYFGKVPIPTWKQEELKSKYEYLNRLYKLYNFIQYLIWFTM